MYRSTQMYGTVVIDAQLSMGGNICICMLFAIEDFKSIHADQFGLVIGREVCQLGVHTYLNFDIEHIGEMTPKSPFLYTQLSVVY